MTNIIEFPKVKKDKEDNVFNEDDKIQVSIGFIAQLSQEIEDKKELLKIYRRVIKRYHFKLMGLILSYPLVLFLLLKVIP